MNYLHFIIYMLIGCTASAGGVSLSGRISDKQTGQPLPGATVYLPDLKRGTVSAPDGTYRIDNLPKAKVLVQVNLVGYLAIVETMELSDSTKRDFALLPSIKELHEVFVTGASQAGEKDRNPVPATIVTKTTLLQNSSSNIIDAIASQPGLSQVSTGAGISKPVIRGLGYNRVVVVSEGIRQEGQQWGDEHGIEVDEFSVHKVEILKGPASLSYGSDALAGVIHMMSAPTLPEGSIEGKLLGNYQSNNRLIAYSGNLAGNLKNFIWDIRYSGKESQEYRNKYDGRVYGSAFSEKSLNGIMGLNKSWGYSHLHFSMVHQQPGIVEGDRDSATGAFSKWPEGFPHQDILHYKAALNSNVVIGNGNLKSVLGIQQNHRKEFADPLNPEDAGLYLLLNTANYDLRYLFPEKDSLYLSAGINGMGQSSENKGVEYLIPEYRLFDIGVFSTVRKSWKRFDVSGGLRFDRRFVHGDELLLDTLGKQIYTYAPSHIHKFSVFSSAFSSLSGSLGFAFQHSEHFISKLNLSRGFRAPNIAELGSNGEHEGTGKYDIGNPQLKSETSLQLDYGLGIGTEHFSMELDLFYNRISNFIFSSKLSSVSGGDSIPDPSNPIPAFRYVQGDAGLYGGEVLIDLHPHPLDWLHFENSFSYVLAEMKSGTDSTRYLPMIPAARFSSELRADIKKSKRFANAYFKINLEYSLEQDKVYSASGTETATPSYALINAGMGGDVISGGKTLFSAYLSINNLSDVAYQSHLSRLKYLGENYATGRRGVYNMGRNISVKMIIPIRVKNSPGL